MSRIGKMPIKVGKVVKVELKGADVFVEGPKGKLSHTIPTCIKVERVGDELIVTRDESVYEAPALHGLTRSLIANMVQGVEAGFTRELDIVGVGYRASVKGQVLTLNVGYSHPIDYALPPSVSAKVENNTHIVLNGPDKMVVGMCAAKIRSFRKPEPYQGKGIKYTEERLLRKQGKASGSK
jgi:large subunit ribosomal protein L6